MRLPMASYRPRLINGVSRSASLNPAQVPANQPNFTQRESATAAVDFQGFCAI
jgi:hypothetical protein